MLADVVTELLSLVEGAGGTTQLSACEKCEHIGNKVVMNAATASALCSARFKYFPHILIHLNLRATHCRCHFCHHLPDMKMVKSPKKAASLPGPMRSWSLVPPTPAQGWVWIPLRAEEVAHLDDVLLVYVCDPGLSLALNAPKKALVL